MAPSGSPGSGFRLDIQQILSEAQHRWLRPAEICEILQNYKNFHIASEPPYKPCSGSLFLFDRKVLRYFRKDGHNWRKKKDGKTVKEAHEKLKVGSVDMLHCYYAHGEENENFQRRSYWMLEQDLMHIVFVHYLEVKGNKTNISYIKDSEKAVSNFQNESLSSYSFSTNHDKETPANTDSTSPTSTLTSAYEDAETEDNYQVSSRSHSFPETTPVEHSYMTDKIDAGISSSYPCSGSQSLPGMDYISPCHGDRSFTFGSQRTLDSACWEGVLEHRTKDMLIVPTEPFTSSKDIASGDITLEQGNWASGQLSAYEFANKWESGGPLPVQAYWQIASEDHSLHLHKGAVDQNLNTSSGYDCVSSVSEEKYDHVNSPIVTDSLFTRFNEKDMQPDQINYQKQHSDAGPGCMNKPDLENDVTTAGTGNYNCIAKRSLLDGSQMEEVLKKADSFSRWIAKELGDVEELHMRPTSDISWSVIESGGEVLDDSSIPTQLQLDTDSLNPSLCQDQLFSIIDFSPSWAYSDLETEVLVTGTFLKSKQEVEKCRCSCMFGEVEVSAEILADGSIRCHAPPHRAGLVHFYVTCSNRLACSEVREFEYRNDSIQDIDGTNVCGGSASELHLLHRRLEKLLCLGSITGPYCSYEISKEKQNVVSKLNSLMEEEENHSVAMLASEKGFLQSELKEQIHERQLKEKLYSWLLYKITEDGKGPSVLDEEGQGVPHLAAALGYNWALKPTLVSGVHIDFRDVNGWTALHWAAFFGREDTVVVLVSLGASPGALTDPSPEFPLGRTPADLASANGHKGISGFLAEFSLTTHLASLTMNDPKEDDGLKNCSVKAVRTISERSAIPTTTGDAPDDLSLKDSLAAVCNATQAACRIHQIFRMQSFERNKFVEHSSDEFEDEKSVSFLASRTSRLRQHDGTVHAAAVCIQKKFRGWKKRKEFLMIRQRIVKIQAHVRGHQVRKKYKPIIWSVGILEKVILRWRRKGSGLRGFRSEAVIRSPNAKEMTSEEDDYDFLKDGRKQTEERMQKALSRVKSMVQYPEARAQYRRLLTVAEGFRETKQDACNMTSDSLEDKTNGIEDLIDMETFLDEDTFMSIAFE